MNYLLLGTADKTERLLQNAHRPFLWIDDNPPRIPRATYFDPHRHSFNPLAHIDHKGARDIATMLYSLTSGGQDTLTVKKGRRSLADALLNSPRLDKLKGADDDAQGMVDDVLFSPVLRRVLCGKPNFTFESSKTIVAKLDRAELGDFDAQILAALLIGHYSGQVIVPDGGAYLKDMHVSLIRQNRLMLGLNFLAELPTTLRNNALLIKDKEGKQCLFEDAETLASYAGLKPGDVNHTDFVQRAMA